MTPRLIPVVVLVLLMLALPITVAILGFLPKRPSRGGVADSAALRQALEAAANRVLDSSEQDSLGGEWRILVPDPAKAARSVATLAAELHGTSIEGEVVDRALRMVVSVPEDQSAEFLRRLGLLTGESPVRTSKGLMVLLLVSQSEP